MHLSSNPTSRGSFCLLLRVTTKYRVLSTRFTLQNRRLLFRRRRRLNPISIFIYEYESIKSHFHSKRNYKIMCRSADYYDFRSGDRSILKIKAFFVRFSGFDSRADPLSDSLTLLFPPRISDTARLEISGSIIRSGSPAFVTLHRLVKLKTRDGEAIYGSRKRVRAGDGARFEVYSREGKVSKGVLRREEEKWKMECKCALERSNSETIGGKAAFADVCVAVEGDVAMG